MRFVRILACSLSCLLPYGARADVPAAAAAPSGTGELAAIRQQIDAVQLEPARAVSVSKLKLNLGLAELTLDGTLVPASAVAGKTVELVFLGHGRIALDPPDEVEAGQLDLHVGEPRLDEEFEQAVLVVGLDAAVSAILRRPAASLDAAATQKATDLYGKFRKSTERKLLGVEGAILIDALGDPALRGYFAGWFQGKELGGFYYLVSPDSREQLTLGQFVPFDGTDKEKKDVTKAIHKEQKRGRLVGLETDDLGSFDTWVSAPLRDKEGKPRFGSAAFRPRKYTLDLKVDPKELKLGGKARIELDPVVPGSRVVTLNLANDLKVDKVTDGDGAELFFQRTRSDLAIVLPAPPAAGKTATVVIEYGGVGLVKVGRDYALANTVSWYPRDNELGLAVYDATYRWPKGLDLLAAGHRTDGGEAGGLRFERRVFDKPVDSLTFELGDFQTETIQAGHVAITMAFDRESAGRFGKARQEMLETVRDAVLFFEDKFGPYPLDELSVVTTPHPFSQSLQGFITLSDFMMMDFADYGEAESNEKYYHPDRRLVIAHEVSHQWWGHLVGWANDRDQWISEAMANYSGLLYGRQKLEKRRSDEARIVGLTMGWHLALAGNTKGGRPLETIGPVVLGSRLSSSRSGGAYFPIVYMKGSLVLEMLARDLGEETFNRAVRQVVKLVDGGKITTEDFLDIIARSSGQDLAGFASQYVYGTGMPEVIYNYRVEPRGPGKWAVVGSARQQTPYRFRFKAVPAGGGYDVERHQVGQGTLEDSTLVVPIAIEVAPPDGKRKGDRLPTVEGQIRLTGATTDFDIPLDYEPKNLWLDRDAQIFGRFYNERRYPKRVLYFQGLSAAAAGRKEEAEKLFDQAYAAETEVAAAGESGPSRIDRLTVGKSLNVYIDLSRARLYLDQGRDADAEAALGRAKRLSGGLYGWQQVEIKVLDSRLDARKGSWDRIVKRLRHGMLKSKEIDNTEGYVLLAIAAQKTGDRESFDKAAKEAKEHGADLSALTGG
jgi:hypothetical protein